MIPRLSLSTPALRDAAAVPPETWERLSATASNPVGGSARRLRQRHYWRGRPLDELCDRKFVAPAGFEPPSRSLEGEPLGSDFRRGPRPGAPPRMALEFAHPHTRHGAVR